MNINLSLLNNYLVGMILMLIIYLVVNFIYYRETFSVFFAIFLSVYLLSSSVLTNKNSYYQEFFKLITLVIYFEIFKRFLQNKYPANPPFNFYKASKVMTMLIGLYLSILIINQQLFNNNSLFYIISWILISISANIALIYLLKFDFKTFLPSVLLILLLVLEVSSHHFNFINLSWELFLYDLYILLQAISLMNKQESIHEAIVQERYQLQNKFFAQVKENELIKVKIKKNREEIAANLHDDVGSLLGLVNTLIQSTKILISINEKNKALNNLHQVIHHIASIKPKIHTIILNEHIKDINQERSINELFTNLASIIFENAHISYQQTLPKENAWLDFSEMFKNQIFLIYKEILNNITKHSQATNVQIGINIQNKLFQLQIKDNGVGFDKNNNSIGHGLNNIQKRVKTLKGKLSIHSEVGKGTDILITIAQP